MTEQEPRDQEPREPTDEELRAAFDEELRRLRVQDVLLQTAVTLVNLTGRRLGLGARDEAEKDLEQARLGIEGTRALLPLLPAEAGPIRDALSQLQLAYAREAGAPAAPGPAVAPEGADAPSEERPPPEAARPAAEEAARERSPAEAERARARSRIWTPPGT